MGSSFYRERLGGIWIVLGLGLILAVVTVFLLLNIFGGTKTESSTPREDVAIRSLTCTKEGYGYPFFQSISTDNSFMRIVMAFWGDEIDSVSLQYELRYESRDAALRSEAVNHAAMNNSFQNEGLQPDAFDASYGVLSDMFKFGLFVRGDEMDETAMKYLLADGRTYDALRANYIGLEFECE